MSITIQIDSSLEQLLRQDAERKGLTIDQMVSMFIEKNLLSRKPKQASISKREAELLQKIDLGIPAETWADYHFLKEKISDGSISPDELPRFQVIAEEIEIANAKRMEVLFELSKIRRKPLRQLMKDLGIANETNE